MIIHTEDYMANTQTLIAEVYSAFNQRNIDGALALMRESVSWPKASEGGRVVGKEEIRAYWSRQWKEFDPHVDAGASAATVALRISSACSACFHDTSGRADDAQAGIAADVSTFVEQASSVAVTCSLICSACA